MTTCFFCGYRPSEAKYKRDVPMHKEVTSRLVQKTRNLYNETSSTYDITYIKNKITVPSCKLCNHFQMSLGMMIFCIPLPFLFIFAQEYSWVYFLFFPCLVFAIIMFIWFTITILAILLDAKKNKYPFSFPKFDSHKVLSNYPLIAEHLSDGWFWGEHPIESATLYRGY